MKRHLNFYTTNDFFIYYFLNKKKVIHGCFHSILFSYTNCFHTIRGTNMLEMFLCESRLLIPLIEISGYVVSELIAQIVYSIMSQSRI